MKQIEAEYKDLEGILPKNYQVFEEVLLRDLIRIFNSDAVRQAKGDVFGRIYEFFLMKFSMQGAGAQEGGEFFTPPSLVDLIVNFIQPDHGIVHDPACGSGGMFVQSAHFIKNTANKAVNEAITCYGTEYKSNTTRLAKMNLAIHGIEGKISNRNSFYSDPHGLLGKVDFLMANPPFNVDGIDHNDYVKEDKRLPFGVPLTGRGTIPNGNYMWMQYFYSYLNAKGRAGFVMASSATDAGHSEKLIRKQLIETGHVDCIVAISNNFFYTRSLPCHVWFFDKGKSKKNLDKVLMIDARNVYRKVNTTLNDFSPEQLQGLTGLIEKYRKSKPLKAKDLRGFENLGGLSVDDLGDNGFDIEGLCKIATLDEIREQDYSLTPGRYVGVKIDIDEDFDYKSRITEIKSTLSELNEEANGLMKQIMGVEL